MASNLSTPNIPKFESVKVPEDISNITIKSID